MLRSCGVSIGISLIAGLSFCRGQVLFREDFIEPVGTLLTASGWVQSGSTSTNPIAVLLEGGLSYQDYPGSALGNAASLASSGQDVFHAFPPVDSGSLFLSFLVNVSTAQTGDYFIAVSPATHQTNYFMRVHLKSAEAGYLFGISKNTETSGGASYGTTVHQFNTTYLVVAKYSFVPADTSDDAISLFVFSGQALPGSEPPTAEVGPYRSSKLDAPDLGILTLRQGSASAAPSLTVDAIRVGTCWNEAPLPVQMISFSARLLEDADAVEVLWSTISERNSYGFIVHRGSGVNERFTPVSGLIPGRGTTMLSQQYSFVDRMPDRVARFYKILQIDLDGEENFSEPMEVAVPTAVQRVASRQSLQMQVFPNPFNPITAISYQLTAGGDVSLEIFDILGRKVAELVRGYRQPGEYATTFRPQGLASGMYLCKLTACGKTLLRKILLLR